MQLKKTTLPIWHVLFAILLVAQSSWFASVAWEGRDRMTLFVLAWYIANSVLLLLLAFPVLALAKHDSRRKWHALRAMDLIQPGAVEQRESHEHDASKAERALKNTVVIMFSLLILLCLVWFIVPFFLKK